MTRPWTQGVAEVYGDRGDARTAEPPLEQVVLDFGEPLIIHPHQFVLARTLEFVRLPPDLCAYVVGRSSWGRRGLIVATAVIVHPGFVGPVTLELKNVGEVPLAIYPLDRVAQLAFHSAIGGVEGQGASQFASSFSPGVGVVRDQETDRRIREMARNCKKE
jgi:dCTP deaminase